MGNKLFSIVIGNGKEPKKRIVTSNSLRKIIDDFIDNDAYCIGITKALPEVEKQRFYKLKYDLLNRKYKSNKMTEKDYKEAINKLKEIKSESKTVEEFEAKFNEYKKTLTIIPPYNVSDK